MPKRTRRSARPDRRTETTYRPDAAERTRVTRVVAPARATGTASATLEKAAAWERGFVTKDFRRLGLTAAIIGALLVASSFAVNALFPG